MSINHLGVSDSAGTHPGNEGDLDIKRFWIIRLLKVFVTQYNVADGYMPADADYNGITFKVDFGSSVLAPHHDKIFFFANPRRSSSKKRSSSKN